MRIPCSRFGLVCNPAACSIYMALMEIFLCRPSNGNGDVATNNHHGASQSPNPAPPIETARFRGGIGLAAAPEVRILAAALSPRIAIQQAASHPDSSYQPCQTA